MEDVRVQALGDVLQLDSPFDHRGFDVSCLRNFVVASMVRFVDGRPDRRGYRRFKVRGGMGNDDFGSMEEVVGGDMEGCGMKESDARSVVDGGVGQVGAALHAFCSTENSSSAFSGTGKKEKKPSCLEMNGRS